MKLLDKILYLITNKNLYDKEIAQKLEIPKITEVLRIKMKMNSSQHKSEPAHTPGLRD